MKISLINVKRNEFVNDKGEVIKYCKFSGLTGMESSDNEVGSQVLTFGTNYNNYSKLVDLFNKKQVVDLEVEYVKQLDGLYKQRAKKINDIEL